MDLRSLDHRKFERLVDEEVKRLNLLPIDPSVVLNAKSILEADIAYAESLRDVSTPEEALELDARLSLLQVQLIKIEGELTARGVDTVAPDPTSAAKSNVANSFPCNSEDRVAKHRTLLNKVLDRRKRGGESQTLLLNDWIKEAKLPRTSVTDYLGSRIKGRVSDAKCSEIELKIRASAEALGLIRPD